MAHRGEALVVLGAALIALAWWAFPTEPREPAPEEASAPARHAPVPRPPLVIEPTPPALIREAPTRADGLDRADPCAPDLDDGLLRVRLLDRYVEDREGELRDALRARASDAVGARVRAALRAADPSSIDAGVRTDAHGAQLARAVALASGARQADDRALALDHAQDAIAIAPSDPIGFVLASRAAEGDDDALADAALQRAFALAPHEADLALAILIHLDGTSDVMGALAAADALLDVVPSPAMQRWRARLAAQAHAFADGVRRSRGPFTVLGDAALPEASSDPLLDVASSVLARAAEVTGHEPRYEIVLHVHADAETMRACTCGRPEDALEMLRSDLDDPENDERVRHAALRRAVLGSAYLVSNIVQHGLVQLAEGPETDADRSAYRTLVRRGHWLELDALHAGLGPDASDADARLAHAETRALVEWLVAQRGLEGVHELCALGDVDGLRDPISELAVIGRAPLDEATFLAFLSARVAASE